MITLYRRPLYTFLGQTSESAKGCATSNNCNRNADSADDGLCNNNTSLNSDQLFSARRNNWQISVIRLMRGNPFEQKYAN